MKWHTERQENGTLLVVEREGQQWARLIRDSEIENHYDQHFLFWQAVLNLKYAALGWWKTGRTLLDLEGATR